MQFAAGQLGMQGLMNALLPLNAVLPGKFGTDDQRNKMLAIAIEFQVFAGHAGENELLDLIGMHEISVSELPAVLQQMKHQNGSKGKADDNHGETLCRRHVGDTEKPVTEAVNHVKDGIVMRHTAPECG